MKTLIRAKDNHSTMMIRPKRCGSAITFLSSVYGFGSCAAWSVSFLPPAPHPVPAIDRAAPSRSSVAFLPSAAMATSSSSSPELANGISLWIAEASSPTKEDIQLLRKAFAEFYGVERDLTKSEDLLTQTIDRWKDQPADESAGLYRVRGDCYMLMGEAVKAAADYDQAVKLLDSPGGEKADPSELPAALLGRARSIKSLAANNLQALSPSQASQTSSDYERALKLLSREEWDTDEELIEDGASRNPYAAWEWGSVLRMANKWDQAATAHKLAADAFDDIGDRARSVISMIDEGIDLAAANKFDDAKSVLRKAILKTKEVEGRDLKLLQHVITKEGEGRMALAAVLWDEGQRGEAEQVLGDACIRLEQLEVDVAKRSSKNPGSAEASTFRPVKFSIDDDFTGSVFSCYKFKDGKFLSEQLGWPQNLQVKVNKLQTLR
jgi:tetratricopeptide (TPR) repeat protein